MTDTEALDRDFRRVERLDRTPQLIRGIAKRMITGRMKRIHYGQVVPIEDVERIFGFVNSIVRVSCVCRHISIGREERYCYAVSLASDGGRLDEIIRSLDKSFIHGPDTAGMERLSKDQAISALRSHEEEGLCHSVWTFQTPFIGGICNCDRSDCLAMRCTVTHGIPVMFRAEYVAEVDPDLCNGCRQCMRLCQFGAISYSVSNKKVTTDQRQCYGCGICRSVCQKKAIRLRERGEVPAAAGRW